MYVIKLYNIEEIYVGFKIYVLSAIKSTFSFIQVTLTGFPLKIHNGDKFISILVYSAIHIEL